MRGVFDAILWDNDGVLVDTEGLYMRATRETLAEVGVELTEAMYHQLFLVEARGAWHLAREAGVSQSRCDELRRLRDDRYAELIDAGVSIIDGAERTMASLHGRYRMAIVTSSEPDHFRRIHRQTSFLRYVELVLTRTDYVESKPHPEPYLTAARRLGVAPERCVAIEDSERGLRAAKAAEMTCWVVPGPLNRRARLDAADRVLASVSEVASLLA